MTQFHRLKRKRLSDLIVDEGIAAKEEVLAALHEQQANGELLSTVLLGSQRIDGYDMARLLVEQYQVPFVELGTYIMNKDLVKEFPAELLHRARMVPLERFGGNVSFACQEVPSPEVHEQLKAQVDGSVLIFAALARDIEEKLQKFAPYERPETVAAIEHVPPVMDPGEVAEDKEWQSLFDTANESVLSDADTPDSE